MASEEISKERSKEKWKQFLLLSLDDAAALDQLGSLVRWMSRSFPIASVDLCKIVFREPVLLAQDLDPMVPNFIRELLYCGAITVQDTLLFLLERRKSPTESEDDEHSRGRQLRISATCSLLEYAIFNHIEKKITPELAKGLIIFDVFDVAHALNDWMSFFVDQQTSFVVFSGTSDEHDLVQHSSFARETFASLLSCLMENDRVAKWVGVLRTSIIKRFADLLPTFISTVPNPVLAHRLALVQKTYEWLQPQAATESEHKLGIDAMDDAGIMNTAQVNSRSTLLILLDAMFDERPSIPDSFITSFLQFRYKSDLATAASDFVTAAFDALAMSVNRGDPADLPFSAQSYLINKVPLIIQSMSSVNFVPIDYEIAISQALSRLDPSMFPTFSQDFGQSKGGILSDTKQKFLLACALHQLIPEESIERMLGENPMETVAPEGKLSWEGLEAEYNKDPQKLEQLIEKIKVLDGNAVAFVTAVSMIFQKACTARNTVALKSICSLFSRRPRCLDMISLFGDLNRFVNSLAAVLNEFKNDEDQGEAKPLYEEFGACLMLFYAISHRFKLSAQEIRTLDKEPGFLSRMLSASTEHPNLKSFTSEEQDRLGDWLRDLFGDTGVGDELMSTCSPQTFYCLVPTMFQQAAMAFRPGVLDAEALKGGLELLLEAFLIPSLVLGLEWMAAHLQEHTGPIINMLQRLLRPGTLRTDSAATHRTILSLTKKPLCQELNNRLKAEPERQEIKGLIESLQSSEDYTRISTAKPTSTPTWTGATTGGVLESLRQSVISLCYFATNPTMSAALPLYSFQHLESALEISGARETLYQLMEAIREQLLLGHKEVAVDVVTMLIFSSCVQPKISHGTINDLDPPSVTGQLTLHEALQLEVERATKEVARDTTNSNIFIILDRRVQEALQSSAGTYMPMMPAPELMTDMDITQAVSSLDPVPTADLATDLPTDLTMGNEGLQLDLDTALADPSIGTGKDITNNAQAMDTSGLPTTDDDFWNDLQLDDNLGMDFS